MTIEQEVKQWVEWMRSGSDEAKWQQYATRLDRARQERDVAFLSLLIESLSEPRQALAALALTPNWEALQSLFLLAKKEDWVLYSKSAAGVNTGPTRTLAAMIAQTIDDVSLETVISIYAKAERIHELLACLLQEVVIRGRSPKWPAAERFWETLGQQHHPLATMPLSLLPEEETLPLYVSTYSIQRTTPFSQKNRSYFQWSKVPKAGAEQGVERINTQDSVTKVLSSNDTSENVESAQFVIAPGVYHGATVLYHLPLRCFAPSDSEVNSAVETIYQGDNLTATPLPAKEVVAAIMAFASNVKDNGVRRAAAYGRYSTWQTLLWLCGARQEIGLRDIAELVNNCEWYLFRADTAAFTKRETQGYLCTHPHHRSVGVLVLSEG